MVLICRKRFEKGPLLGAFSFWKGLALKHEGIRESGPDFK
jgi:hypothetical protein